MQWNWYYHKSGYARRNTKDGNIHMHRVINKTPIGVYTDHINRNGLDNRKCNLRDCSMSENSVNKRTRTKASSVYRGVSFSKRYNKFMSVITFERKRIYIGLFDKEIDAALAYNKSALKYHGRFAVLNIIKDQGK